MTARSSPYGQRWKNARRAFLLANPLCAECMRRGRITGLHPDDKNSIVDHVKRHGLKDALDSQDPERITKAQALFWDRKNWQPLCKRCHDSYKQRAEKSGDFGCDEFGLPLSGAHHWA